MRIKQYGWFLKRVLPKNISGITLAPFGIFYRTFLTPTSENHEKIHWKQQVEMLIIPFFLWYFIEWVLKLKRYGTTAYYQISFEKEAYGYQRDYKYLITRKHYVWIKLLTNKQK